MGLRYNALDSRLFTEAIKSNVSQCRAVNGQVKSGTKHLISSLGDGTNLSGAAYTAGQGLFTEVMYPSTSQYEEALDDVISDLDSYLSAENSVYHYGDLNEDDLKQQISYKQEQKVNLESQRDYYESQVYNNPAMLTAAQSVQVSIDETERQINDLKKQLEALQEFEHQTSPLFKDSMSAFSDVVKGIAAINSITVDSSGNYYTNGTDMTWLSKLEKQGFDSENGGDKALENAVSKLGLNDESLAYWKKEMQSELKHIPKDQWDRKIKEASESLQFDDEGNILQIVPFQQGVIVLKNGIYDSAFTEQANKEIDSEHWEAIKGNFAQLLVGGLSVISGGLLDLAGAAVITGGAGFTLTGGGAIVGIPAVGAGVAMEGVGIGAVTAGGAIIGNALSKMNVPVGSLNYSFASNYDEQILNYSQDVEENWGSGSFKSSEDSLESHFSKHGDEVGAKTEGDYLRKAKEFARTAKKGSTKSPVRGATEGVIRYKKMENILILHLMVPLFHMEVLTKKEKKWL